MTHSSVQIQICPKSVPTIPCWFAEISLVATILKQSGVFKTIQEQVQFARARGGTYDVIDFVAVLISYAVSGEPTLAAFFERAKPFASSLMALFDRNTLPHPSTLSRFLEALDAPCLEQLRKCFLEDLVTRTGQVHGPHAPGGLRDREAQKFWVFDIDATRQAARQRALPNGNELPQAHRRLTRVCAKAYLGRKRGEVGRSRTTVLQAHSHQWLGSFGGAGNGDYRGELKCAVEAILAYAGWLCLPLSQLLIRLDGLYGNGAVLSDLLALGVGVIVRGKDYDLLTRPAVSKRVAGPADGEQTHPESGMHRTLYDCGESSLPSSGRRLRLIVATHAAKDSTPRIGVVRKGMVYELFLTTIAPSAATSSDVLDLYLHRGSA
jgi:hypothetical protein